jgi:2-polyprenyl-3-methyl-5-hydroxy-6-metoxy-1,4-benzoquinol methylase
VDILDFNKLQLVSTQLKLKPELETKDWKFQDRCPVCNCLNLIKGEFIPGDAYQFGDAIIPFPPEGIAINKCPACDLYYKSAIPTVSFLSKIFSTEAEKVWSDNYDFVDEIAEITKLTNSQSLDVLDIGVGNGCLLKSFKKQGIKGRRSGLDVVKHQELDRYLSGEFIKGLIDDPELEWEGKQYDLVTMFDVIEHLYSPIQAFRNLQNLIKTGGYLTIETGDVENYWPQTYDPANWWYVNLFEHHVFWSQKTLVQIAQQHGFSVISCTVKPHKTRKNEKWLTKIKMLVQVLGYTLNPHLYMQLKQYFGKKAIQPWNPVAKDHLQLILQKTA